MSAECGLCRGIAMMRTRISEPRSEPSYLDIVGTLERLAAEHAGRPCQFDLLVMCSDTLAFMPIATLTTA